MSALLTTGADALTLAAGAAGEHVGRGETVAFWILGPLAVAGGLGMLFARNAVHSALWLVISMLSLGVLYLVQQAPFLGLVQIIVYTGAIMMLFLFVLMMVGRESSDSVVEVLRGQRVAATLAGLGFAGLLVSVVARALTQVESVGLAGPNTTGGGNVVNLGLLLFGPYLFPFELTSALLITAAIGAMVLAFVSREHRERRTQRELAVARVRGRRPSPLPGPGVFATANSVATPALLPDGSIAAESLESMIESTAKETLGGDMAEVAGTAPTPDAHALTGAAGASPAPSPAPSPAGATAGDATSKEGEA